MAEDNHVLALTVARRTVAPRPVAARADVHDLPKTVNRDFVAVFFYWDDGTLSEDFTSRIPDHLRTLFMGKVHWTRNPRYRCLDEPFDNCDFSLGKWDGRTRTEPLKPYDLR